MNTPRSISIIFHENEPPSRMKRYRIWDCAQRWKAMGIDVTLQPWNHEDIHADLIIPQVNLSVLPGGYRPILASTSPVVNRAIVDIQKSVFSCNLVSFEDDYHGPVIIKTNANYGGLPEQRMLPPLGRFLGRVRRTSREISNTFRGSTLDTLAKTDTLVPLHYPVLPSKAEIPHDVFHNKNLVVERFLPECEGKYYFLRSYSFFGNAGISVRTRSESPVIKGANGSDLEVVCDEPEILAARKHLGFDYGKFDYVVHEGSAVLLDVNHTPTFGAVYAPEMREQITTRLASGISQWFTKFST